MQIIDAFEVYVAKVCEYYLIENIATTCNTKCVIYAIKLYLLIFQLQDVLQYGAFKMTVFTVFCDYFQLHII